MADDAKKIQIEIDLQKTGTGGTAAKTDLDAVGDSAKAAGGAAAAFEKDLGKVEHRVGGVAGQSREMYRAFYAIDRLMPGLGEVLRGSMEEGGMSVAELLIAVQVLQTVFADMNKLAEVQQANFKGDADAVESLRVSYEQMNVAAQMFLENLIAQQTASESADAIAKRQIDNFKNLATAQQQINDAQKRVGEADIEALEKNGVISHQQALQDKFQLDVAYAQRKLNLDGWLDEQEEKAKQKQLASEQVQLKAALDRQVSDEATARAAVGEKAKSEKERETAKSNIEDAKKTLDELAQSHGSIINGQVSDETVQDLNAYAEKYLGGAAAQMSLPEKFLALSKAKSHLTNGASWVLGLTNFLDRTIGNQEGPAALAKYEGAQQQIAASNKILGLLDKAQFDVDLNAERSKTQLNATDEEVRKLSKSVDDMARAIPQMVADNKAKEANAATVANLDLRAEAIKFTGETGGNIPNNPLVNPPRAQATGSWPIPISTSPLPQPEKPLTYRQTPEGMARYDWSQLDGALDLLGHGGQLNQKQEAMIQSILAAATGHVARADQILSTLQTINASNATRDAAFESIKREVERVAGQVENSRTNGPRG